MKGHVANSTLQTYGQGCQLLGPHYYACLGTKPHPQALVSGETTSCLAYLLRRTGEDDSPKPSCNKHTDASGETIGAVLL